jgi:hypothetical protein
MLVVVVAALTIVMASVAVFPRAATVLWILALETSPDSWLDPIVGEHETIVAIMKLFGLVLVAVLAVRQGGRFDAWNPGFAFGVMFVVGFWHGLYPGMPVSESVRSLIGSAGPFLFSFTRMRRDVQRAVEWACMAGPLFTVLFGAALALVGLCPDFYSGGMGIRLNGPGEPAFLGGFAQTALYAAMLCSLRGEAGPWTGRLAAINLAILILTGARAPMLITAGVGLVYFIARGRLVAFAAAGAAGAAGAMFYGALGFLRVISLAQAGQADNLSNRDLMWPIFEDALAGSPWVGWGTGAGKFVVPQSSTIAELLGTTAAHDEYLRIGVEGGALGLALLIGCFVAWVGRATAAMPAGQAWLMRAIFAGFAIHSVTDNTLIATTSSVFFVWVSAVFARGAQARKAAA